MATRDRNTEGSDPYPSPTSHLTAARFRSRIRPDDLRPNEHFDPEYSVKRILDGRLLNVGPLSDAMSNPLCGPEGDLTITTDNSTWVE